MQDGIGTVQYSSRTKCNTAHVGLGLGLVEGAGVRCLIHDGGSWIAVLFEPVQVPEGE